MKYVAIACMAAILGLSACGKREEPVAVSTPAVSPSPTVDEAITAVVRGHPHSLTVCYDQPLNGYFVHYKDAVDGAEPDGNYHGWYFLQKIDFYKAANNTWFIGNQPESSYVVVYPDVTGLPCKNR